MNGVTGDGGRTDPLFNKSSVEPGQVIGQALVLDGVGGFRFIVGDLSQTPGVAESLFES